MDLHPSAIGWLLRRTRLGLGLTLGQASRASGLTVVQISAVERGLAEHTVEVQLLLVTYQKEVKGRSVLISGEVQKFPELEG